MIKVVIIGGGLIGSERADAIQQINKTHPAQIAAVCEPNVVQADKIKAKYDVHITTSLTEALSTQPDWVFVCVPHDVVIKIMPQVFASGADVLIEKPLGRTLEECQQIIDMKPAGTQLKIGFNYRFMSGISALLRDVKENKFGEIISVNAILAHGNHPDILKSWKLDPIKCGGVLIDPGVHLLDLLLLMCKGQMNISALKKYRGFWNNDIDEETHLFLSDDSKTIYNLQTSLNRWRSTFLLEVNGVEGYGRVMGRGKSYGPQSYITGKRWGWRDGTSQEESEIKVIKDDSVDDSFLLETKSVLGIDDDKVIYPCDYTEARQAMKLLDSCERL